MPSEPVDLDAMIDLVEPIVSSVVWAQVATAGRDGRPRVRLMHPVFTWSAPAPAPSGRILTRPTPLKVAHVAAHPYLTCAYWSPAHDTAHVDCEARWIAEPAERERVWHAVAAVPPPVGYDPATIWPDGPGAADDAVLALTPYRVVAQTGAALATGRAAARWERAG